MYCLSKVILPLNSQKSSCHEFSKVILPLNCQKWSCHWILKSHVATEFSRVILQLNSQKWSCHELSKVILPLNSQKWSCHWILKSHVATEFSKVILPLNHYIDHHTQQSYVLAFKVHLATEFFEKSSRHRLTTSQRGSSEYSEQAPLRAEIKPFCESRISKRSRTNIDQIAFTEHLKSMAIAVFASVWNHYGVATIRRLLQIIGLFCTRAL